MLLRAYQVLFYTHKQRLRTTEEFFFRIGDNVFFKVTLIIPYQISKIYEKNKELEEDTSYTLKHQFEKYEQLFTLKTINFHIPIAVYMRLARRRGMCPPVRRYRSCPFLMV